MYEMEGILIDVLQSLCEKTSSFLLTAYAPVDSKIENMKAKRNRLIEDAERRNKAILEAEQDSDTENARDIVLDIGDIVDDFIYHQNEQRNWTIFDKIIHFPNTLYRQYRISSELDNINTRIDEWRSLVNSDFKGSTRGSTSSSSSSYNYNVERVKIHGESNLFLEADDLVGIEGPKQELMDLLMKKDRNRIVISVLGMGGSGKTTLVANIFNNAAVKQHFLGCCVWITVSQTTRTVQDLLKYILKDLYQAVMTRPYPINFGDMSYKEMVETIQKLLTGKRYLVVLDDVWNVDTMGIVNLEKAFPGDKPGSRIILTTREMNHAYSLFEVQSLHFHNIEPLGGEKAWQLFCRKAFPLLGGYSCPAEIEPIARDLAKKCGGLPLGLVALGGLMSTKRELDDWFRVLKNLNWELSSNRKVEVIIKILLLSYHDLPHHLKQCFLYCCVFPEDFLIQRGRLIRLWIAEGFVELQNSGTTLEETAAGYIDDLICRSMLRVWKYNPHANQNTIVIHDLLRQMAIDISKQVKLCTPYDQAQQISGESRIYRLAIQRNDTDLLAMYCKEDLSNVRSLIVFDHVDAQSFDALMSRFKLLRVLDLKRFSNIQQLPDQVVKFYNLTYLNLKGTAVKELPKDIGNLCNLETLDIRQTEIRELPEEIAKLSNLRHLMMYHTDHSQELIFATSYGTTAPKGISELKKLQVLDGIKIEAASDSAAIQRLSCMTQLTRILITNVREEDGDDVCVLIAKMKQLDRLTIAASDENQILRVDSVSSVQPSDCYKLKTLGLAGKLESLPSWIGYLNGLKILFLHWSRLREDFLPEIGKLPNLIELLLTHASVGEKLEFREGFKKLTCLMLCHYPFLNEVVIEAGVMPALQKLHIIHCKELRQVPIRVEHLRLRELSLRSVSVELIERMKKEGPDYSRVRHVANVWRYTGEDFNWKSYESLSEMKHDH